MSASDVPAGRLSRRGLMARLGLAAGAAGITGIAARQATAGGPARPSALPPVVNGGDWRIVWPGVAPGTQPPPGALRLPKGRLFADDGAELGTFEASVMPTSGAGSHLHHLNLSDGTITAVGPATFDDATYAVIGGTGRYAGASGSYNLVQRPAPAGGTATFTFNVTTPEV